MSDENRPPTYAVPLLSLDDILDVLNNKLMLQVKKTDLNPGNPEKLKEIYVVMLELFHPDLSFISQQRFKDLGDAPDEMEDAMVALNIYSLLKRVLARMNYHDISQADLFIPNFKRTKQILSHLINFWGFVSLRDNAKGPLQEKFNKLTTRKVALIAESPNIQRKINDIATETMQLREGANLLYTQQVTIRNQLKDELAKKEAIQRMNAEKKTLCIKLSQENKVLKEALDELKVQRAKLSEEVVESPEQMVERTESRKQLLALSKAKIVKLKKRLNDAKEYVRNYKIIQTRVLALMKNAADIQAEMTFAVTAKHGGFDVIDGKKQALRENIIDTETTHKNLLDSLKQLQEKDSSFKHQHSVMKNRLKAQLNEAETCKKNLIGCVTEMEIALTGANEEYSQLITRMKKAKKAFKVAEQRSKSHLETMTALDVYHNILGTHLKDLELVMDRLTCLNPCEFILEEVRNALGSFDKDGT